MASDTASALMPPPPRPSKKRSVSHLSDGGDNDAERQFAAMSSGHPIPVDGDPSEFFRKKVAKLDLEPEDKGRVLLELDRCHSATKDPAYQGSVPGIPPMKMSIVADFLAEHNKLCPIADAWVDEDSKDSKQPVGSAKKHSATKRESRFTRQLVHAMFGMQVFPSANAPFVYNPGNKVESREVEEDADAEEGVPAPVGLRHTPPDPEAVEKMAKEREFHSAVINRVMVAHDRLVETMFGDDAAFEDFNDGAM